jgi:glycosyltransferase involved in cell wall biosynthesis
MQEPTVSFVVPCYKLAHFLRECVNSVLAQTYSDFEVLIMDDCSPDETAGVARSFQDRRVKHIRNDLNLGALRNYNKGIQLSRGKYVWLISADDYLRCPYVLQSYVDLMDTHPRVGFTFCPGVEVKNGKETALLDFSTYGNRDRIVSGRAFLKTLLYGNLVLSPAAMARRECYERISFFPINPVWAGVPVDLIWGGDWYLWCAFALHSDVGYFAEPMTCYREHALSSTSVITKNDIENCFLTEIAVRWKIKQEADEVGYRDVSTKCLETVAIEYARHLTTKQYRSSASTITIAQFEESLCQSTSDEVERNWIRCRVFAELGARHDHAGDIAAASKYYQVATHLDPWMIKVQLKKLLLSLGKPGHYLGRSLRHLRRSGSREIDATNTRSAESNAETN